MSKKPRKPPRLLSRRTRNLLAALIAAALLAFACTQHTNRPPAVPNAKNDENAPAPDPSDRQRYNRQEFTVVKVVDGDTFDLAIPDLHNGKPTTRVRLWGVDTPETKHPKLPVMHFGPEAAAFTRNRVLNKKVSIYLEPFQPTRGKYRRLLAYVYLPPNDPNSPTGPMLNEQLLTQGYAYADTRFDHILKDRFLQLQKQAQRQSRGLWKNVTPDQHPKWYQNRYQK